MPNEVVIIVRAIDQTKPVFDRIKRDARQAGDEIGETITTRVIERIERDAVSGNGGYARAGETIGETIARRISERISRRVRETVNDERITDPPGTSRDRNGRLRDDRTGRYISGARSDGGNDRQRVKVDVDIDRQSLLSRLLGIAKSVGDKLKDGVTTGLQGAFQAVFSGDFITSLIKIGVVSVLASVLAPALGAAISAGILLALGGGVLAAGIASALQDPQILAAAKDLGGRFKELWLDFGENFKGPVAGFLESMLGVLEQLNPLVDHLGETFGPVAEVVADGLVGFLQNALPGILRAAEASAPVWKELGESLPQLGDDIARFFDHIAESGPEATLFINDFIAALGILIRILGIVISTLANMYAVARTVFLNLLNVALTVFAGVAHAAEIAFGWVPGLGGKLAGAEKKIQEFRKDVNAELDKIKDKTITVHIQQVFTIVGQVASDIGAILKKKATGGIQGAATGGLRSGLTLVGEQGPELVNLAPGSQVHSNPDSRRLAAAEGAAGGQPLMVQLLLDGAVLAAAMIDPQRKIVRQEFGGDVQLAWGN